MEWISVKDRRPKVQRGSRYYGANGVSGGAFTPLLFYVPESEGVCAGRFFGKRYGYWSLQGVNFKTSEVTYWQPMPAPPEEPQ